ncbi:MAG TPA: TolC family protein [Polyangiaceae bacterium]
MTRPKAASPVTKHVPVSFAAVCGEGYGARRSNGRASKTGVLPLLFALATAFGAWPLSVARGETSTPGSVPAGAGSAAPSAAAAEENDLAKRLHERVTRPGGLTAEEVARRAIETSPEDRARKADVETAESEIDRTRVDYYPRVTLTARYTRLSPITPPELRIGTFPPVPFPVILDQYLAQAGVTVPLSDYFLRIRQSHDAAVRSREAAELNAAAARRAVAAQAKLDYYGWARAKLGEIVTAQSVEQANHHLEFARAARDAGRAPTADVLRAESLVAAAELADARMRNAALLAEERLHTVMHDSRPRGSTGAGASSPYEIGEDLLGPLDAGDAGEAEALYREAVRRRPELRALERTDSSLRSQRDAAQARGLPRLDAFGNAYLVNPSPRVFPQAEKWLATWDMGVQVTWSPNDLGGASSTERSLDARRKRLDAERAALTDSMRDEITSAVLSWREARSSAETADRGLVASEEGYRVRRELFDLGRGTSVELIDAESDVLRARLEMIQARVDARVAKVRLEHAVGR